MLALRTSTWLYMLQWVTLVWSYSTFTIYPEFLAQGGRTHFETDRWDGHNGLDLNIFIEKNKAIGTESGRWLNLDIDAFQHAPEDPHRKGYADPSYFSTPAFGESHGRKYLDNLKGYGNDSDMVMELNGGFWPKWMNMSMHKGKFPNNLDAAADMVLLLLQAVDRYSHGRMPPYFEVVNEPGVYYEFLEWDVVVRYHQVVAEKLKAHFPKMKIGGPTNTGYIQAADVHNFSLRNRIRDFLDMSLQHLDFFSFHAYNGVSEHGGFKWSGINEARLTALIDLIQSYAIHKKGHIVPLIISEYGLNDSANVLKSVFAEWAYAFAHNSLRVSFLQFRGVIDRAVAFLLSVSPKRPHASIFYNNHTYTNVGKAYEFWHHFRFTHQFLRVEEPYDGNQRLLVSLALVDTPSKQLSVLFQNYHKTTIMAKLVFPNQWASAAQVETHCYHLDSSNNPVLDRKTRVSFHDNILSIPSEATCYVLIPSHANVASFPTVQEHTYYAKNIISQIHGHSLTVTIDVSSKGSLKFANLRFAISTTNKHINTKPTQVHINGNGLSGDYALYEPDKESLPTVWDVYVYKLPVSYVKQAPNTIRLDFAQDVGQVSTVAIIVGSTDESASIIG